MWNQSIRALSICYPIWMVLFIYPLPGFSQTRIHLSVQPPTLRIGITGDWQGKDRAEIACAQNETESFQAVVTARGGFLRGVDAEVTSLRGGRGEIPAERIVLYREEYVRVKYSSPRATEAPGLFPDPLIPFRDPYSGEAVPVPQWDEENAPRNRFGAAGFDLWEDHHQPLWIDVHVPPNTPAGTYAGEIRVWARNAEAVDLPIQLTVWDFTLPAGPTHENHFGGFGYLARYHGIERDSPEFHRLEDRYAAMMAAHRLNPPLPARWLPEPAEDGSIQMTEELDKQITEYVNRLHVTNLEIPRAPFRDALGADRPKAIRFYRSWYAYLQSKGWESGAYHYMLDEPNDAGQYEEVRQLGALLHEAEPRIRRLVVEQPYGQDPAWGVLDGAIDIWCPLFGFIDEDSVKRVQAQGDAMWSYTALVQAAPSYHPRFEEVKNGNPPYWQIDFPLTAYRIAPWLNRRYGITGLLYWSTVFWQAPRRNPWDDPGFRLRFNGDGALFYPGNDAGIDGPVASLRLKALRDGMEDYEYFALLEKLGGKAVVDEIVRQAVPTWAAWEPDGNRLMDLRRRLAEEILKRRKAN